MELPFGARCSARIQRDPRNPNSFEDCMRPAKEVVDGRYVCGLHGKPRIKAQRLTKKLDRIQAKSASQLDDFVHGYYCAVAVALREAGTVTKAVQSMFEQGGAPERAAPEDVELFKQYGLMK